MVCINAALLGFVLLQLAPAEATARLTALIAGLGLAGLWGAKALWRQPTRRRLARYSLVYGLACGALVAGVEWRMGLDKAGFRAVFSAAWGMTAMVAVGWWFLTMYRAHQIESRLRELAERDRAVALAGQLMAAQIQPHFLFNSLASLQHWVHTRDERAGPLLDALTGFLRDTLPLFNRPQLALAEELPAVQHYMQVMQARLGDRLQFAIDIPPALRGAQLPPGLLLTLVENAVEHGVQPSLRGGTVRIQGLVQGPQVLLQVADTGPGPAPGYQDGVGLTNCRARLAQAWGDAAWLQLDHGPQGGCLATVTLPIAALDSPAPHHTT
jgi:signal transduction histidine kinase